MACNYPQPNANSKLNTVQPTALPEKFNMHFEGGREHTSYADQKNIQGFVCMGGSANKTQQE